MQALAAAGLLAASVQPATGTLAGLVSEHETGRGLGV